LERGPLLEKDGRCDFGEPPELADLSGTDWERIVAEHGPAVWATVYRILKHDADAQDCYQQTFLDAFRATRRRPASNWAAFLARIAARRAIDRLRERAATRNRRRQEAPSRGSANPPAASAQHVEVDLTDALRAALAELPPSQATVFWLRNVEELSYAEIADQMGISTNKVGVLLHRARASLARLFPRDEVAGSETR
jgi:RNA polymerase sigma-70 factor (ECF subfamily)